MHWSQSTILTNLASTKVQEVSGDLRTIQNGTTSHFNPNPQLDRVNTDQKRLTPEVRNGLENLNVEKKFRTFISKCAGLSNHFRRQTLNFGPCRSTTELSVIVELCKLSKRSGKRMSQISCFVSNFKFNYKATV